MRLKELRDSNALKQKVLAELLGVSVQAYSNYENEYREIGNDMLGKLAQFYKVSVDYILGRTDVPRTVGSDKPAEFFSVSGIMPMPDMELIPLLGTIACGEPILAEENVEEFVNAEKSLHASFALRCKGDSMINARIFDGDIVYIRQQNDVDNGEIAAVLIEDEATLKRVYKYPDKLVLRAENPTFKDLVYSDSRNIKILGKAVAFLSTVR